MSLETQGLKSLSDKLLEAQLYPHLDLPCASRGIGAEIFRSGMPEHRTIRNEVIRRVELYAIEEIVELEAQIELHALADTHLLCDNRIGILYAGAAKTIPPQVAGRTERRRREERQRGAGLGPRIAAWRHAYLGVYLRPLEQARVLSVHIRKNFERQTARENGNARHCPAFQHLSHGALLQVFSSAPDGNLPRIVGRQAVGHVKFRIAALGS